MRNTHGVKSTDGCYRLDIMDGTRQECIDYMRQAEIRLQGIDRETDINAEGTSMRITTNNDTARRAAYWLKVYVL